MEKVTKLRDSQQVSTKRLRSCYCHRQRHGDLNPDYYLRQQKNGVPLQKPSAAWQRTGGAEDMQVVRHHAWRLSRDAHILRRPTSHIAMVAVVYTGMIFLCGLVSKADKDAEEAPQTHRRPLDDVRTQEPGRGNLWRSHFFSWTPFQKTVPPQSGLGFRILPVHHQCCEETDSSEPLTITSAIIDSCLYLWPFCLFRSGNGFKIENVSCPPEPSQSAKKNAKENPRGCAQWLNNQPLVTPASQSYTCLKTQKDYAQSLALAEPSVSEDRTFRPDKNNAKPKASTMVLKTENVTQETFTAILSHGDSKILQGKSDVHHITSCQKSPEGLLQACASAPVKKIIRVGSNDQTSQINTGTLLSNTSHVLDASPTDKKLQTQPILGHLSERSLWNVASQEVTSEDAKQVVSSVQLVSLLLLPELCV